MRLSGFEDLPGFELVAGGTDDLAAGRETEVALLVAVAAPRLRSMGLEIPLAPPGAKDRLWDLLTERVGDDAHRRYNALLGRVLAFAAAYESIASSGVERVRATTR